MRHGQYHVQRARKRGALSKPAVGFYFGIPEARNPDGAALEFLSSLRK